MSNSLKDLISGRKSVYEFWRGDNILTQVIAENKEAAQNKTWGEREILFPGETNRLIGAKIFRRDINTQKRERV